MPIFSIHLQAHLSQEREQKLANTNFLSYLQPHLLSSASLTFSGERKKDNNVDEIDTIFKTMEYLPPILSLDNSVFNFVKGYVNFNTLSQSITGKK